MALVKRGRSLVKSYAGLAWNGCVHHWIKAMLVWHGMVVFIIGYILKPGDRYISEAKTMVSG